MYFITHQKYISHCLNHNVSFISGALQFLVENNMHFFDNKEKKKLRLKSLSYSVKIQNLELNNNGMKFRSMEKVFRKGSNKYCISLPAFSGEQIQAPVNSDYFYEMRYIHFYVCGLLVLKRLFSPVLKISRIDSFKC